MELINSYEDNDDNTSIVDTTNYLLADRTKDDIEKNSFVVALDDIVKVNEQMQQFISIFKTKESNKNNLYKFDYHNPNDIIAFFNDHKDKLKDLNKYGFNPATIMITVSLYEIEKDVIDIKNTCESILNFLENDKESEIKADVQTLIKVITEYKYNWQDEQYINNNYKLIMDIKRTALKNINFYQKQISKNISNNNLFITNKGIDSKQNELEKNFTFYRLSLYIYSFAVFLEIMLLENFQENYLLTKKEEIENLSNEYIKNYQDALMHVKKEANKSIQSNLLSSIGNASKTIGNLAEKVQIVKDKKIDIWLNKNSDNLKNKSQDMKNVFSEKFKDMSEPNINIFINKIDLINNIYNKANNIYFDTKNIYLEIMK